MREEEQVGPSERLWPLRVSPERQRLAERVVQILIDEGTAKAVAPIIGLHLLDYLAKEIARCCDMTPDAVNKTIQRELRRLDVPGRGSLVFRIARNPRMFRGVAPDRDE